MSNILVEARCDPNSRFILEGLAATCAQLGHSVRRWRGPLSGRVPFSRRLPQCDIAILFNGAHHKYTKPVEQLRRWNTQLLFIELGWYPQLGTFQLDHQGINAAASWAQQPLTESARTRVPVRPSGDLLVLLQHDEDTQITGHSPWFANMHAFVAHLSAHSRLPLRVRLHPRHPPGERVLQFLTQGKHTIDWAPRMAQSLDTCRAVACVNSSAAIEALAQDIPVLCYGHAIYRHPQAVYCLDNDGQHTQQATAQLAAGQSEVYVEPAREVVRRITTEQWQIDQIANRLPPIIESLAHAAADSRPPRGWHWPFRTRLAG